MARRHGRLLGLEGLGLASGSGGASEPPIHLFIVMGQSNSTARSVWDSGVDWPSDIYQLGRSAAPETASTDLAIIPASRPLDHWSHAAGGMGFALQFFIDYKTANPEAIIMIIPAGEGGTGFWDNRWNVGDDLYSDAVTRTNYVTGLGGYSLKGLLWHQGERDAINSTVETYQPALDSTLDQFRIDIGAPSLPIVTGSMIAGLSSSYPDFADLIQDTPNRVAYCEYVDGTDLTVDDGLHYDNAGYRTLGSRYYTAWLSARSKAHGAPAQVTGLSIDAGDGTAALSWSVPSAHPVITDYAIERDSVVISDGTSTSASYTDTGLTNDAEYSYRVAAINASGQGPWSDAVTVTPVAGSVSPEAGATGHWLFGSDNPAHTGLVGGDMTEVLNAATLNAGYVSLTGGTFGDPRNGLSSSVSDTAEFTALFVARIQGGTSIIGGTRPAGSSVGGHMGYVDGSNLRLARVAGGGAGAVTVDGAAFEASTWSVFAYSRSAADAVVGVASRSDGDVAASATIAGYAAHSTNTFGIGNCWYLNGSYADDLDVAEAIVWDSALSQAQIEAVIARTVTRLAARGITVASA